MIVLSILSYILIGLGVLLAALLFIPYHYDVNAHKKDDFGIQGSVSWLFGGLKIIFLKPARQKKEMTLVFLGLNKKLTINKETKPKKDNKKPKSKKSSGLGAFLNSEVIKKVFNTLGKILRHSSPKYLTIDARVGFSDPMYTGLMCASLNQFNFMLNRFDITLEPVFDEEILEGRFSIGGKIWLPYLILVVVGLLITKPIRTIIFTKKKRKK